MTVFYDLILKKIRWVIIITILRSVCSTTKVDVDECIGNRKLWMPSHGCEWLVLTFSKCQAIMFRCNCANIVLLWWFVVCNSFVIVVIMKFQSMTWLFNDDIYNMMILNFNFDTKLLIFLNSFLQFYYEFCLPDFFLQSIFMT